MNKIISVIVVTFNNETVIEKCIKSILNQDFPIDKLEIIIVDGMSSDNTVKIADNILSLNNVEYKIINNKGKILAKGWNLGIKESQGSFIIRPDAHSILDSKYLLDGLKKIEENDSIDAIGGVLYTTSYSYIGNFISIVLSNPIGVGPSSFRIGLKEDKFTDTIVYGIYKKEIFNCIGMFNENLKRNQDIDFHKRLKKNNFNMLTSPSLKATYYSRANLTSFIKQSFDNGFWVGRGNGHIRHFAPFAFIIAMFLLSAISIKLLIFFICFYIIPVLLSYIIFSKIINPIKLLIVLYLTFSLHIFYGFGTLIGLSNRLWRVNK